MARAKRSTNVPWSRHPIDGILRFNDDFFGANQPVTKGVCYHPLIAMAASTGGWLVNERPVIDQYWRSRTINEAQLQGYTGLRLTCGCGRITDYPFTLLLQRQTVTRHNFIGNIRISV